MRSFSSLLWGSIFVILGVALLLDHLGYWYFDLGHLLRVWWPLILVVIGLGILMDSPRKSK